MTLQTALGLAIVFATLPLASRAEESFFQPDDRIALVGNTTIERARLYGSIETAMHLASEKESTNLTIRNFGWSADSVFADSRSYFGEPEEGRTRLEQNITDLNPDILLFLYGTGEAMSVDQGWTNEKTAAEQSAGGLDQSLSIFIEGYAAKIESLRAAAGDSLREIVLVSPPPLENLGAPMPDQKENNERLALFRDAIRDLASKKELRFVDLFAAMGGDSRPPGTVQTPLTDNGVHYTAAGYEILARELLAGLGYENASSLSFEPETVSALREIVVEKNRLFFHRWRPANETYLFLFRAHEQGQNAKEIPLFDPLIAEQETLIAAGRDAVFAGDVKN